MAFILSLLSSVLPYLLGIAALVASYFFVKNKGVQQERQKQEEAKQQAIAKVTEKVTEAVIKDTSVDKSIGEKIEEIKQAHKVEPPSQPDKFRF
jgi:hypothetical protein